MVKRAKFWKAGVVLLTTLAFSLTASAPSSADSLSRVAQWYTTVYGTTGPVVLTGSTPAADSPVQVPPTSNVSKNNGIQKTATANPVAPPTTPTPTSTPRSSGSAIWCGYHAGYNLNADEQQLLGLVNQQRVANHLPAFTVNLKLSYLARLRAQDMANNQNLTHYSPTYGTPPQMEEAAGISGNPLGAENICEGPSVTTDNSALFNSPPHRANLLDPNETQIGLGVVRSSNGIVWVSELFLGN